MRCLLYFVCIFLTVVALSCGTSTTETKLSPNIDTAKSFRILGEWVTPNQLLDYDTARIIGDTLRLVTCNKYVYSPFGDIKSQSDFKQSLLKSFVVERKREQYADQLINLYYLHHGTSKLIFFFDSDDPATHSLIYKGEIRDTDVIFENGIKPGMIASSFYASFFNYFPKKLEDDFNVVVLESCVTGIEHTYTLKDKRLQSVKFTTDYIFDINY